MVRFPWGRLLLVGLLAVAVYAGLSFYGDVRAVGGALAGFRWQFLLLVLLFTLLNYALRFGKWHYYLRHLGERPGFRVSLGVFLSGLSMPVTPAKLGEAYKAYLLKRRHDTAAGATVAVVFAERVTDLLALLLLAAIGASGLRYGASLLIPVCVLLLGLILLLRYRKLCLKLIEQSERVPLLRRLAISFRPGYQAAYSLFGLRPLALALILSTISWFFECLALYYILVGFDAPLSLPASTFIFSFSSLLGAVSLLPGGLVIAEGSFSGLMLYFGSGRQVAAAATILIRFATLWFGVGIGFITLWLMRRKIY